MRYSPSRVDAHQNGDCDATTCPICELDALLDTVPCDGCGDETSDPAPCDHGNTHCRDCADEGYCHLCERERAQDIADDEATERALDAWRAER